MLALLQRKIKKILFTLGFGQTVSNDLPVLEGRTVLVICTGPSIKTEKLKIDKFIKERNPFIIGVNESFLLYRLDACLITNTKHFRKLKEQLVQLKHPIWVGWNIPGIDLIGLSLKGAIWTDIFYHNSRANRCLEFVNKVPNQDLRTSGSLAICLGYLTGAQYVYVVGMDGYTEREFDLMRPERAKHQRSLMKENYAALRRLAKCFKSESGRSFRTLTKTNYRFEIADWESISDGIR